MAAKQDEEDIWAEIFDEGDADAAEPPAKARRVGARADSDDGFIDNDGVSSEDPVDRLDEPSESEDEPEPRRPPPKRGTLGMNEPQLDEHGNPATAFDEALARLKKQLIKRDYPEPMKSDFCDKLLAEMQLAHEEDETAMKRKKPALAKLALVPKVERVVFKAVMQAAFLEAGGLNQLSNWLRPVDLPDAGISSMIPNIKIRTMIFKALHSLQTNLPNGIGIDALKESHIGKVVLHYYRLPAETRENRSLCYQLCQRWLNNIVAGSTSQKFERQAPEDAPEVPVAAPGALVIDDRPQSLEEVNERIKASNGQRHARMPRREGFNYKLQPQWTELEKQKRDPMSAASKMTRMLEGLKSRAMKASSGRAALNNINVSLEGRGMHLGPVD